MRPGLEVVDLPPKAPSTNLEDAVAAYVAGESAQRVGPRFGVCAKRLTAELRMRGLFRTMVESRSISGKKAARTQHAKTEIPDAEIVARYLAGESEKTLAVAYGVNRATIGTTLRHANVTRRGLRESQRLIWESMPLRERQTIPTRVSSHAQPIQQRIAVAKAREQLASEGKRVFQSPSESVLASWLRERGMTVIQQQAIGPYNVDIGAHPIAVEIWGGSWHFHRDHTERNGYLFDAGWDLILVFTERRRSPLSVGAADQIVALADISRSKPASGGQYWVIWGNGEIFASGDREHDKFTRIVPRRTRHGGGA